MIIDNYTYSHLRKLFCLYAFSQIFDCRDVTLFLANYKGAEPGQPVPAEKFTNKNDLLPNKICIYLMMDISM